MKTSPPIRQSSPRLRHAQVLTCSCGRGLIGIRMIRKDGTRGAVMPCHAEQTRGDGRKNLVQLDDRGFGHLVVRAGPDVLGHETHWGNCPDQKRYER